MVSIHCDILHVSVVSSNNSVDKVYVHVRNLPNPFPQSVSTDDYLTLTFECPKGTGKEYIKTNFGVDAMVFFI